MEKTIKIRNLTKLQKLRKRQIFKKTAKIEKMKKSKFWAIRTKKAKRSAELDN